MSTSRATSAVPAPGATGEISAAFDRQKREFVARNAAQCPYLLVQLQPDLPRSRLTLIASFAFYADREWQQVESHIAIAELQAEAGAEPRFTEAFLRLDDGIGAARIARLFSPLSQDQRLAAFR